tara:strand:- start:298 stop:2172 length:1875 start_codon:yes stop_codon:yes gene_type:complete
MATQRMKIDIIAKDKTKKALNGIQRGFKGLTRSIFSLRGAIAGLGVGLLIRNVINTGKEIENLRLKFKFLFGSVTEGNKAFRELVDFAGKVPFSLEQIAQASGNLAVVSKDATELREIMEITGNVAAVTGIDFRTTGEQMQRALSGGIAAADIFREKGVRAMLGFQQGATISIEETARRFKKVFGKGGRFGNATDEFAKTFEGTMSMIQDKVFIFKKEMIEIGFWNELKTQLGDLNKFLSEQEHAMKGLAEVIGTNIAKALVAIGKALEDIDWDIFKIKIKAVASVFLLLFGPAGILAAGLITLSNYDDLMRRLGDKFPALRKNQEAWGISVEKTGLRYVASIKSMERSTRELILADRELFAMTHGFNEHIKTWQKHNKEVKDSISLLKTMGITIISTQAALTTYHTGLDALNNLQEKTNMSTEVYNVHRKKLLKTLEKNLAMTDKQTESLDKENETLKQAIRFGEEMGVTFTSAFEDAVVSGSKFSDVLKGIYKDILRITLRYTITEPMGKAFSSFVSSAAGSLFGGSRAEGGPVSAGRSYVVGERGPELFTPTSGGSITPSGGGGANIVQNINVTTGVQQTVRAEIIQLMPMIRKASVEAVLEERSRGGQMAQAMGAVSQNS